MMSTNDDVSKMLTDIMARILLFEEREKGVLNARLLSSEFQCLCFQLLRCRFSIESHPGKLSQLRNELIRLLNGTCQVKVVSVSQCVRTGRRFVVSLPKKAPSLH